MMRRWVWPAAILCVVLVCGAGGLVGALLWRDSQTPGGIAAAPTATVIDRGGVITEIRNLKRLETKSITMERVIAASLRRDNALDAYLGDSLTLRAVGVAIAGVDLARLRDEDVVISPDGASITITLPPSAVLHRTLDNQQTAVVDRETKVITRLVMGADKDLETLARQRAEGEILLAACEAGLMEEAASEARRVVTDLLRTLRAPFQHITVNAAAGPCTAPVISGAASPQAP